MAINKNFVIKHGAEINTRLFVADANTQKIGIGTTNAYYDLHVYGNGSGGIGATFLNVTGITTTQALSVAGVATFSTGPVLVARGELTGTASQSLQVGTATTVSGAYISGDVGIGVTLPGAKLNVVPTASGIAGLFSGTTSGDMVRITQLGAGNALVVEDETNTDATAFVISGLGSVGIGTAIPRYLLDIDGTKVASEGLAIGQTAVYIRGDVKIVGDLSADDLILDQAVFTTLNVAGFSTLGGTSATLLNVSGIATVAGAFNATQGADLARLRVTGITTLGQTNTTGLSNAGVSTLGNATASTLVVSGFSTFSGGASAVLFRTSGITTLSDTTAATLNVAGFSTLGSVSAANLILAGINTGLNAPGISTLGFVQHTTLNVTGFSTLGSVSVGNLTVAGITTGLNAPGISTFGDTTVSDLFIAGITTGLNATGISTLVSLTGTSANFSGISTLTSLTGTNVRYTGVGTIANVQSTNLNVSGVTTVQDFNANGLFNVFATDATFFNNVTINGNLSIGGTSTVINAAQLRVEDKDIVLGFTTSQLPTDDTANHGGIAIASTEGFPLVPFQVAGINTLPDTYKQIMWMKRDTMGAGTTDAWLFNYGVGIGSTQVPNGVRLAVGAIQLTDDAINARIGNITNVRATNVNTTGITTTNSLSIDATQVISSARQLQNIASLDATTTATIEAAISNAPNTFTDLTVTGITTLGQATAGGLNVTGFTTLGATSATLLNVSGVTTVSGGLNASQGADLARLRVTGITTLGQANVTGLSNAGVSTLGNATASTLVLSGFSTFSGGASATLLNVSGVSTFSGGVLASQGIDASGLRVTGITTLGQTTTVGLSNAGVSTLGNATASTLVVSGFATHGATSATILNVSGISTIGNVILTPSASGAGATVGASVGVVTYFGDGSRLSNIISGVGIQSAGNVIGYGITTLNFVGTGNTFAVSGNTVNISISGSGGGGAIPEVKTNVSTTDATGVGSFATATYRSAMVSAQIVQDAVYQVGRYLMIHDGTTVTVVEQAAVSTGSSMVGSFDGIINGANAQLRVSLASTSLGIATVTTKIDTITL